MKSLIGIGNALTDILVVVDDASILKQYRLPEGSMNWVDAQTAADIWNQIKDMKLHIAPGGSTANTIKGAAKLGLKTSFVGMVGDDQLGNIFNDAQKACGIKPQLLTGSQTSGRSMVFVTPPSGERTFANFMGATLELGAHDIKESFFKDYDILHIEGYLVQNHDLVRKVAQVGKKLGKTISIDLASYNVVESNYGFLHEIVENYVDIVFANEHEAKAFTGKAPREALESIAKICEVAVVKVGAKGSLIKSGNTVCEVEPVKAHAIDTTGAGDMYAAGFLYGYANGFPLEICGKTGSIVSSEVVRILGTDIQEEVWAQIRETVSGMSPKN